MRQLTAFSLTILLAAAAAAGDWPNFRGPNHDGISTETGLKADWSSPPKPLWERQVGDAFSGISIVGDRVYSCGTANKKQIVFCLNAQTGEQVWQTPIEDSYWEPQGGNGPRSTPTIADGRVYVLGALGRMLCLDAADGKVVWEKKYGPKPQWGFSGSILIEGDMAVVSAGGEFGALVAYDRKTGKEIWKSGEDPVGYSTPYPFTFEGERYIVGFTGKSAIIVRAKDGQLAWREPWKTDWDVNAAAPIFHEGYLYLTSGYDTGSAVFKLSRTGDKITGEHVWAGGIDKVLLSKFQSSVLTGGYLFASDQRKLACVEFMTGKEMWKEPRIKDGTVVLAEARLFVLTEGGELIVTPATKDGFKPATRVQLLEGRCWTVPTIANGRLYVRNQDTIKCYDLK